MMPNFTRPTHRRAYRIIVSAAFSETEVDALAEICDAREISRSQFIRDAVILAIKKEKSK